MTESLVVLGLKSLKKGVNVDTMSNHRFFGGLGLKGLKKGVNVDNVSNHIIFSGLRAEGSEEGDECRQRVESWILWWS